MDAFSFPFRFAAGHAVMVDDASEAYQAQLIAAAIQTQKFELKITPDFGSSDIEFRGFDEANFVRTVSNFIPTCRIDEIEQVIGRDEKVAISVKFIVIEG
jgi:hypothetical protein